MVQVTTCVTQVHVHHVSLKILIHFVSAGASRIYVPKLTLHTKHNMPPCDFSPEKYQVRCDSGLRKEKKATLGRSQTSKTVPQEEPTNNPAMSVNSLMISYPSHVRGSEASIHSLLAIYELISICETNRKHKKGRL